MPALEGSSGIRVSNIFDLDYAPYLWCTQIEGMKEGGGGGENSSLVQIRRRRKY